MSGPTHRLVPVWDGYCADPFVLATDLGYVMYGTSVATGPAGARFPVLVSDDLATWRPQGWALRVDAAAAGEEFWAPEVAARDGRFWMYYSRGVGDPGHRIRVAVAHSPLGPFEDTGTVLTGDLPFAIDPSPFLDQAGQWWLFFAMNELTGDRPGTRIAVQRMAGPREMTGEPHVVLRPDADWQRFEADREMYGGRHDWHTLEGPFVVHRLGRYWMTFSGGNWQGPGYGVGVAVADHPGGPWTSVGDGALDLGFDAEDRGAGHGSVATGPDGRDVLVLHAWDSGLTRRRPFVVPLEWTASGPRAQHRPPR